MLAFLTELELVLKDFIIFVKKLIRRNKNYDIKRFERRLDRLFNGNPDKTFLSKTIILSFIKLKKRLLTNDNNLKFFKFCLKYLIYFVRYYKRFPVFIFFLNIVNKQFYQSHSFNFFRELSDLLIHYSSTYLTEFERKYIQAQVKFYKKRSSYLFFRFFRVLRFKLFFIFFYFFNLFNIIILRNFITNTPLDANLPVDRGEYHAGNRKFNFFPRIFLTFMESIMVNVRPFQKYLDTFNLMKLNLRGLNGMFYHYIIVDLIKLAKFFFDLIISVLFFFRTRAIAFLNFLVRILFLREHFYCFLWVWESTFNFYYRIGLFIFNLIFRSVRLPFKPLLFVIHKFSSLYNHLVFTYLHQFVFLIIKLITLFIFFVFLVVVFLIIFFKFSVFFKIVFLSLLVYYYCCYRNLLRNLNRLIQHFSFFKYNSAKFFSHFSLSFFYVILNELKSNYKLSPFIYALLVRKVQILFSNKSVKFEPSFLHLDFRRFFTKQDILITLNNFRIINCIDNNNIHCFFYFLIGAVFKLYHERKISFYELQESIDFVFTAYMDLCKKDSIAILFNDTFIDYERCDRFLRIRDYRELLVFNQLEILYILLFFYSNDSNGSFQLKAGLTCFNQKAVFMR